MNEQLSTEQKIDFIYDSMLEREKREKRKIMMKWGFRIFMLVYIGYFYFFALPGLISSMKDMLTPDLPSIDVSEIGESSLGKIKELLNR